MKLIDVKVSIQPENIFRVTYRVEGRKGEGKFDIEKENSNIRAWVIIGEERYRLDGMFDLKKEMNKKYFWEEFLDNQSKHGFDMSSFGMDEEIWEALTKASDIIDRGDVKTPEEEKMSELTSDMKKFLTGDALNEVYYVLRRVRLKPLVREWTNTTVAYLTILSCKINEPLTLLFDGPSQSGKTYLCVRAKDLFDKMVDVLIGGSKESFKYSGVTQSDGTRLIDLRGKCIMFLERDQAESLIAKFKPLMSHDDYEVREKTTRKDASGDFQGTEYIYRGWPSFIVNGAYSTTVVEQINRAINMTPEKSKEKDEEMNSSYWDAMSRLDFWSEPKELEVIKKSHDWLPPIFLNEGRNVTLHQFGEHLKLLELTPRDREKLTGLVQTITMLHQLKRVKMRDGNNINYLASFEDVMIALGIFEQVYQHSRYGIPKQTYDVLKRLVHMKKEKGREIFTIDEIWNIIKAEEALERGDTLRFAVKEELRSYLDSLVNYGLITFIRRKRGEPEKWRVRKEEKDLKSISLTQLFISKVETNDFMERIDRMEKENDIEYPDYRPFINIGGKLYNYLMDKCYFRSGKNIYRGEYSAVYKIFSEETQKILFNDKIVKVGQEEIKKKIEMDAQKEAEAKKVVSADDWWDTEEGQQWIEWKREKHDWEIQFVEDEGRYPEPWEYPEYLLKYENEKVK